MSSAETADSGRKNLAERGLSVLAEVRAGEGAGVLLLSLNIFLLLLAYYLIRPVRDALILAEGGAEVKSYAAAGQALLLLAVVPAYGAFASRVNRIRLITWVTLFFASHLVAFYAFGAAGVHEGVVFYLWVGIFNVLIVAQFWAFANDLNTEATGKRLFPIIMLAANLGAAAGGKVAASVVEYISPYGLMLATAAGLILCILTSRAIHRHAAAGRGHSVAQPAGEPLAKTGALELLMHDRYLMLIAVLTVLLNVVNTNGEYLLDKFVLTEAARVASTQAAQEVFIAQFKGNFQSAYSVLGMLLQMFAVSRIFRRIGVRGALFILPCIALGSYSAFLALPVLGVVRWAKILENGTDYSVQNTTRQALFLITSREAKYKAKAAIDTFFQRAGDVLSSGVVYLRTVLALGLTAVAGLNLVLTLVWLAVAFGIARQVPARSSEEARREALGSAEAAVPGTTAVRPAGA